MRAALYGGTIATPTLTGPSANGAHIDHAPQTGSGRRPLAQVEDFGGSGCQFAGNKDGPEAKIRSIIGR